jgi:DNA (cytosine-5)-methyltransferase 1
MEGQRSSLVLEAIRLISECRPSVFVWENVKGTFSSNDGADFWAIIQAFTNIGGYRLEWQLLNTSWFLPQNRERIYLVGYSTTTSGRGVFPIGEISQYIDEKIGNNAGKPSSRRASHSRTIRRDISKMGSGDTYVKVKSATSKGYEEATSGDSINLSQPNSETRRGRVGKQKAQTLETSCNQAVVEGYRIRRLTPIECERLQGFPDDHTAFGNYDGVVKPMSNTQRYKQCGNAVTVDVVAAVAKNCLPLFKTNQQ